ncbi:MAG: AAA family ATPase [Alphaproteobacteria bacterium]|uniref:AAA family ATPase n=1 Tax=Candidatus Nitrobium versatile TaxID=2884831 RepID=A0A953M287_9BACT|nr:AAA family ATPase [Candidatus Nitrobium versatile]
MKIAVTGKGGVGKTTLSAILCHLFAADGKRVIAMDADPDANLAQALGIPPAESAKIRPIADMADLIEERTGAKPGTMGGIFKLNPRVDDLPEGLGYTMGGITLLVTGKSKSAASGCYCPENVLLRRLLKHLVVERNEVVVVDMEAGIEHLTRGTAEAVDAFIVVVEPGQRSIQTALTVQEMARGLGVKKVFVVANKIRNENDIAFLREHLQDMEILGAVSFSQAVMDADVSGASPFGRASEAVESIKEIKKRLESSLDSR